jgi:hypothetical protein
MKKKIKNAHSAGLMGIDCSIKKYEFDAKLRANSSGH